MFARNCRSVKTHEDSLMWSILGQPLPCRIHRGPTLDVTFQPGGSSILDQPCSCCHLGILTNPYLKPPGLTTPEEWVDSRRARAICSWISKYKDYITVLNEILCDRINDTLKVFVQSLGIHLFIAGAARLNTIFGQKKCLNLG